MFKQRRSHILGAILLITTEHALADEGVGGIANPILEYNIVNSSNQLASPPPIKFPIDDLKMVVINDLIRPYDVYKNAGHVTNGVALRGRTSGTIHLRGIHQPSQVKQAFLYWNFSDGFEKGEESAAILINGHRVNGKKVADNEDPYWGMIGNHSYRADVTPYVPLRRPNEDYHVVPHFDQMTSSTEQNLRLNGSQEVRTERAWLIVIYENETTQGGQLSLLVR